MHQSTALRGGRARCTDAGDMTTYCGVSGVVLAGGLSRRMGGGDKCLAEIADRPLLAHVIERLAPQVDALALNANGDPARFASFGLTVLPDSIAGHPGPLAGVLAGMDWAADRGARCLVSVAADTPFFPHYLVAALRAAATADKSPLAMAMTPREDGGLDRHPTFGLWDVGLRDDLRAALAGGLRKVVEWTGRHGCARAIFHDPGAPFFNVNTPGDLARARTMAEPARA